MHVSGFSIEMPQVIKQLHGTAGQPKSRAEIRYRPKSSMKVFVTIVGGTKNSTLNPGLFMPVTSAWNAEERTISVHLGTPRQT